ncbi:hypothetical protein A0H81_08350 [Grifola frondosa]|uniref:F-box domain-containing protein n=1 Tax=Grifola frondosa TaxID=5627 RepID=A0A1C7M4I6_GRIFR|nr:hypothetical protein A0H81_08350 [Grifola frondosa]
MYIALQLIGNIGPAPQLEVFRLYHYEDTEEYDTFMYGDQARDLNLVPFGGDAPRMRSIALWGVHIPWPGAAFLRTGGLVELELAYHTRDVRPAFVDFMNILRASPNLENLTLCLSGPTGNPADWSAEERQAALTDSTAPFVSSAAEPVVLPKLTELALSYLEPDYLTALLARLSFPALTSLAVDFEDADYSAFVQSTLAPLLSRVTAAKFSGLPCNAAAAGTALSAMSRVSSLNVNLDFLAPAWYTLLVGPPLVCPHLEALTTTGVGGREMKALVRARREQGAPLAAVYMDLEDEVSVREERWLARHVGTFERFEGSDVEDAETEGTVETDSDENLMWDGDTEVVGDHAFD